MNVASVATITNFHERLHCIFTCDSIALSSPTMHFPVQPQRTFMCNHYVFLGGTMTRFYYINTNEIPGEL